MSSSAAPPKRILSMDQYRGYAIFGMLLVDYFGMFKSELLEPGESSGIQWLMAHLWQQIHHPHGPGFTFADLIAPVFMFVVGMGMRLTMVKRLPKDGVRAVRHALLKRYAVIVMLGFTIYTGYLWDALLNIGLAGILVLWVVERKIWQRFAFGVVLVSLYQLVYVVTDYNLLLQWESNWSGDGLPLIWKIIPFGPELVKIPINGGPLGHWSWALMIVAGTIAYDIISTKNNRKIILHLLGWGVGMAVVGLILHTQWPISKNWATSSFAFWASGLCFLNLLLFYLVCDVWGWEIPNLSVLGVNPLTIYILQWCICETGHRFINEEASWTFILIGWLIFYGVCYGTARYLYEKNIIIKI